MNIAVLAGGISPERKVSLTSASLITNALIKKGHSVALMDIAKNIDSESIVFSRTEVPINSVDELSPTPEMLSEMEAELGAKIGHGIIEVCKRADVVFLALHGGIGENGQLQAILDSHGIHRYTGSDCTGSLLAMDKDIAKILLRAANIPTPNWVMLSKRSDALQTAEENIGYPCVIKPNGCGSSVGVALVNNREELACALDNAFSYESSVMCEQLIRGRELTVGILAGEVLPAIEIIPKDGFYDYKNKYQAGRTTELCPAPITDGQFRMLADETKRGFDALHLSMYSRFDYIISHEDGLAYCLEANTLPGMTPTSLLPQMAAAVGIEYGELCERLCMLAKEKN